MLQEMKAFVCGSVILILTAVACAGARPNLLLITADDLGFQLSCYGEKNIATPRLDALAREGVRFATAYVAQSSCSSSRAALLTGRWPHQNGQIGLAHLGFRMQGSQPSLPALLKSAGYRTGIIGKLHVEPAADFPFDWRPGKGLAGINPTRDVKWVAEQSRLFFASVKQARQPFFYYVNFFDPHGPLNAESDQVNGVPEKPLRASDIKEPLPSGAPTEQGKRAHTARVLNTVLRLDTGVGLLLDELKSAGFADNTLVVFVSDNGLAAPRGKTTSYELGVRVPLMVRWPGTARAAQTRSELVSLLDLMPTLLSAAGLTLPAGLAGQPLQPLFRGETRPWRELLITEMNFHEPQQCAPQRSVRDANYKLLLNLAPKTNQAPVELYDLNSDPWEEQTLAEVAARAEVRRRLESALLDWRKETSDPLLDSSRLQRWRDAADRWNRLPRTKSGPDEVVHIPAGELELLR
jgi:N-sulfoglucosamine sulfohydrolase